jgi:hypothetical protein
MVEPKKYFHAVNDMSRYARRGLKYELRAKSVESEVYLSISFFVLFSGD